MNSIVLLSVSMIEFVAIAKRQFPAALEVRTNKQ